MGEHRQDILTLSFFSRILLSRFTACDGKSVEVSVSQIPVVTHA